MLRIKDWAASYFGVRIFVTGKLQRGLAASCVHSPEKEQKRPDIWIWSHLVVDGAGKAQPHFDLISQDTARGVRAGWDSDG